MVLKFLKIVLIGVVILVITLSILLMLLSAQPAVPTNYTQTVKTGGALEAQYLAMGEYDVSSYEASAMMSFGKYEIYYPSDIEEMDEPLPAVVFVNGTGTKGTKYPSLQKHLASWGFITIATEEEHAWNGFSAEMSVRYLEMLNSYQGDVNGKPNPFYRKIDVDNIGVTGHSQGGFGVVNAITTQRHSENYKAAVILSSNAQTNEALQWEADATQIQVPTFIVGSTGNTDALLASPDSLRTLYEQIPESTEKVLAIRNDADHGQMLYFADGYVTAWFLWLLKDDAEAAKVFTGDAPELLSNPLYQEQQIDMAA
mgnify:CR=1 FL=1